MLPFLRTYIIGAYILDFMVAVIFKKKLSQRMLLKSYVFVFLCQGVFLVLLHWFSASTLWLLRWFSASTLWFRSPVPCCGIFNFEDCGSQLAKLLDASVC